MPGLPVKVTINPAHKSSYDLGLTIKPGGYAEVEWPGWGCQQWELNHRIRDLIEKYFSSQLPTYDYYWRATNNKDEIKLIKSGELRPSLNHADSRREKGLSVTDHLGYVMALGYKYGYRVRGKVIGCGSDGEPILALDSLEPLDKAPRTIANIEGREDKQYRQTVEQAVKNAGWTMEHYRAAIFAYGEEERWWGEKEESIIRSLASEE